MTATSLFRFEHTKTDDSGDVQLVDGYGHTNEVFEKIMRLQPHGFSSNPPVGSHGLGLRLRGQSDLAIALMLEHQDKRQKNILAGNAVVYDATGNVTSYLGDGGIWHDAGSRPQKLTAKKLTAVASGDDAIFGSKDKKTYIGGDPKDGGTFSRAMTEDGPSNLVYIRIA